MALSNQQVTLIHQATLQVLATTGVEVGLPRAVEMLRDAGAHVAEDKLIGHHFCLTNL